MLVGGVRSVARIVVSGYMIRHPVAGNLLAYFHYLLGLHRLGHQVTYVEESGWASACYDPVTGNCGDDPGPGLRAVRTLLDAYGVHNYLPNGYFDFWSLPFVWVEGE